MASLRVALEVRTPGRLALRNLGGPLGEKLGVRERKNDRLGPHRP